MQVDRVRRRRRSRCGRRRRRTRSGRRRPPRARRGRRRSRACRREKRPSVTSAASAPRPGALHRAGDREHLAHARARPSGPRSGSRRRRRRLILPGEDLLHRRVLAVEHARGAVEAQLVDARRPSPRRPSARASRAGPRCRPARGSGRVSGCTTSPSGFGGSSVGEVLGHRLAGDGEAVAVQQPGVEQLAASRPARRRSRSRSTMWYLPCGFMSAMCGTRAPMRLKSSSSSSTRASLRDREQVQHRVRRTAERHRRPRSRSRTPPSS